MSSHFNHGPKDPGGFVYDALPSFCIRLLERAGKEADGTLRFNLRAYNLNDPDLWYHCLSYTWGNPFANGVYSLDRFNAVDRDYTPENSVAVLINERTLHIQKNLHDALSTLPDNIYDQELNEKVRQGKTYLHRAAISGSETVIRLRIRRGMRVDVCDDEGRTALHYAAEYGHAGCAELLCKAGILRGAKDNRGKTAADLAKARGHSAIVSLLETRSDQPDPEPPSLVKGPCGADDLIWVDAICINQGDIDEKSAQVSIMDRIYSNAGFVLAWLGPEDCDTEVGFKTLKTLADHIEALQKSDIVPYGGHDKANYEAVGMPLISWPEWMALASIFQRQWFKRAWIVQEAVLPDTLLMYCGKYKVNWWEIGPVAEALRRSEAKLGTSRSNRFVPEGQIAVSVEWNMAEIYKYREFMSLAMDLDPDTAHQSKSAFTLEDLINCFWTFLATNPRDKIFSLYGILNVFRENRLESDYRQSVESIYTAAARQIMLEAGNLSLLSSCVFSHQRRGGLPSWVPDFGLPGVNAIPDLFSADKGLQYHPPPEGDVLESPVLAVQGLCLGTISLVCGRQAKTPGEKFCFDHSWLKMALSLKLEEKDGVKPVISELLWRTLCMDMSYGSFYDAEKFGFRAPDEFGNQFKIFMMIIILAAGDAQTLEHFEIEHSPSDLVVRFIMEPYNPFQQDLESILADLDIFSASDGEKRCTPTREEVLALWDSLGYTLSRLTRASADGSPVDVYLPPDVMEGRARIVGSGMIETDSTLFRACMSFATAYSVAYGGRQLFTLGNQHLGLGPLSARAGDEVWILPGLSIPAVLRRSGEGGYEKTLEDGLADMSLGTCRYHFVGAAFVHGIMRGEAVEGISQIDLKDIELV